MPFRLPQARPSSPRPSWRPPVPSAKATVPPRPGGKPTGDLATAAGSLDRVRVDDGGHALTTNQGVPVSDNQNSLKAGLRGPTLLEDFMLREKITHFDHERIPERVVHARGSAAHGYFEAYEPLTNLTRAAPFQAAGKITPVFVRFSTVAGERGSTDTARDVRGFAVKFYTDEGNWDLVGNNIPVFFIQDAMKFPDLVHAVKPEPHNGMPQAASAHDTFWDFASLMPETTHMLMWVMSDRGIPRSLRMMQGFGVHTFRLVNAKGASRFVKFHWKPKLGTHSLVWDEAVKISGADSDFHRRDLWDAIEAGEYPEWELGLQVFTEAQAENFSFDVLDATKLIPEELVPVTPVGRMVLNRNPDNFFAETEQVAFCTAHVVPGIDFSNDPLLAGRIHSYIDTQITRLGGVNFHEIPINAPLASVHNNQRDGLHRQAIPRGRVAYEPNSLGGGCPFQAGTAGFVSFPQPTEGEKLRGKPEKFAEHYAQASLFYESQTEVEKAHIVGGFRFELSKVTVPAIRERMVASLVNVSAELAAEVAAGLGMTVPKALPKALTKPVTPEVESSAGTLTDGTTGRRWHSDPQGRDPGCGRRGRCVDHGDGLCTFGGRRSALRDRPETRPSEDDRTHAVGGSGHPREFAAGAVRRTHPSGRRRWSYEPGSTRPDDGLHQGPVSPRQDDPGAGRVEGAARQRRRLRDAGLGRARSRGAAGNRRQGFDGRLRCRRGQASSHGAGGGIASSLTAVSATTYRTTAAGLT